MISEYKNINPYITKDGSQIRELIHPDMHNNKAQSLAEAIIQPGQKTIKHQHGKSEELYYILSGQGMMTMNNDIFSVKEKDSIAILPGTPHCIENTGAKPLHILCMCSPAYSHADTELLE
ncbi:MAG: cupin domain-containing protein [Gammaproteobacteria bacterium]|nr:cupin domain-containing protein [Gammaproteobacteria bacterium]